MTVKAKSEHVAIVWVQITHPLLLFFRNADTLVRVIPPPVFQHETDEVYDVGEEGKADEADANDIAGCKGAGFRQKGEGGDEAAEVAEPDLPPSSNGTTQMSGH